MKYLKMYENFNTPQIGDYVYVKFSEKFSDANYKKLEDHVGEIEEYDGTHYNIKFDRFEKLASSHKDFIHFWMSPNDIVVFAKTKEELELRKNASKYNL